MDPVFSKPIGGRSGRRTEHRVLGLNMRPLSIGHLRLLLELQNAFPDYQEKANFGDVAAAALVCSQPYRESRKLVFGRFAWLGWKLWARRCKNVDQQSEEIRFRYYINSEMRRPETDSLPAAGERRAPLAWRLLAMLMSDFSFSFKEALEIEVSFALTLWAVESDRRAVEKLADERQLRFRSWVKQMEAERLEKESK